MVKAYITINILVDLATAHQLGFNMARVPAYSPYAVAEHAVALLLTVNRNIHKGYNRVRDGNFSLTGLLGFDLFGKTVGIIGTGMFVFILVHETIILLFMTAIIQ